MKSKKEVKDYLEELKEQYENWQDLEPTTEADAEEAQIIEIQIETLEWVLK